MIVSQSVPVLGVALTKHNFSENIAQKRYEEPLQWLK
jgi:hypothetical protein